MRVIGAILALLLAGCSLGFVAGPPAEHARVTSFTCSDSIVAPVIDSVLGGSFGLIVVNAVGTTDAKWAETNTDLTRTEAIAVYAPLAALAAVSAYYGYRTVRTCRAAREEATARVEQRMQALPPSWPPSATAPVAAPPPAPPQPSQ